MKRFFTLIIAVLLVFSCTVTAFAADATPDELLSGVTSIEVVDVPKTSYSFLYDTDYNLMDDQWEEILESGDLEYFESVLLSSFFFCIDLEDAQILATYSDGHTEYINPDDCTAVVLDMPASLEDEEFFRDYTVQVEYMGCTDTYTITLYDDSDDVFNSDDIFDEESNYEFVSCVPPVKNVYVFEDIDAYPASTIYPGLKGYLFDIDDTGISVTLLNKTTGETEVFSGDSIYCYSVYVDESTANNKTSGDVTVFGEVMTDEWEVIPFEFSIKLSFRENALVNPPTNPGTDGKDSPGFTVNNATKDSATNDKVNNEKSPMLPTNAIVGNKVVNTGQVFPATVVLVIVGCLAMSVLFIYRKRRIK